MATNRFERSFRKLEPDIQKRVDSEVRLLEDKPYLEKHFTEN